MRRTRGLFGKSVFLSAAMAVLLTMSACGYGTNDAASSASDDSESAELETNQKLHEALPDKVKESGVFTAVMLGVAPPYWLNDEANKPYTGEAAELTEAVGQVLGAYEKIMKKYHRENKIIDKSGIDLASA